MQRLGQKINSTEMNDALLNRRREMMQIAGLLPTEYRKVLCLYRTNAATCTFDKVFNTDSIYIQFELFIDNANTASNIRVIDTIPAYATIGLFTVNWWNGENLFFCEYGGRTYPAVRHDLSKNIITLRKISSTKAVVETSTGWSVNVQINKHDNKAGLGLFLSNSNSSVRLGTIKFMNTLYIPCERIADGRTGWYNLTDGIFIDSINSDNFRKVDI